MKRRTLPILLVIGALAAFTATISAATYSVSGTITSTAGIPGVPLNGVILFSFDFDRDTPNRMDNLTLTFNGQDHMAFNSSYFIEDSTSDAFVAETDNFESFGEWNFTGGTLSLFGPSTLWDSTDDPEHLGGPWESGTFELRFNGPDSENRTVQGTMNIGTFEGVPEPSSLFLAALGGMTAFLRRRR